MRRWPAPSDGEACTGHGAPRPPERPGQAIGLGEVHAEVRTPGGLCEAFPGDHLPAMSST